MRLKPTGGDSRFLNCEGFGGCPQVGMDGLWISLMNGGKSIN
jgi:hypothetical protein